MEQVIAAMTIALSAAGTLPIPEGEDAITWTLAECQVVMLEQDFGAILSMPPKEHTFHVEWALNFDNIAKITFIETDVYTLLGQSALLPLAQGKLTKDIILNKSDLVTKNLQCGNSYKAMTDAMLPFSKY